MNEQFYVELKEKIQPYFEKSGSHSFNHTLRVFNLCLSIANEEDNVDGYEVCERIRGYANKDFILI